MKVAILVPAYRGLNCQPMINALAEVDTVLRAAGHLPSLSVLQGSCYVQVARNELIKIFRESGADVALFWDDDISLGAQDVLHLVEMEDDIVVASYRYKNEQENYPVVVVCDDDGMCQVREDGCIKGGRVPTGMMAIKRTAIERLCEAYPERAYTKQENGQVKRGYFDLFPQGLKDGQWIGEDFAFCDLWRGIGGTMWVVPDVDISHHGKDRKGKPQAFTGNYHRYLQRQPGGSHAPPYDMRRAGEIGGWLSLGEGAWLAEQAAKATVVVELGSFYGRSTRSMADNSKATIYAVDNWEGPPEVDMEQSQSEVEAEFRKNLADHIESGHVVPVVADHADVETLDTLPDPDMVFIDGDHSIPAVSRDIAYWIKRVKPGGLICGHDSDWHEVDQVVEQLIPEATHVPNTVLWAYRIPAKELAQCQAS